MNKFIQAWKNPEIRKKRIEGMKKTWNEPISRKKHIESLLKANQNSAEKKKMAYKNYWKNLSEEEKQDKRNKLKEAHKHCKCHSIEGIKKNKETHLKNLLEYPELHPNSIAAKRNRTGISYIEILMGKILKSFDVEFITQYPVVYKKGSGCVKFLDFYLPKHKLGIECDGERWHTNKSNDEERDKIILSVLGEEHRIEHITGKEIFELAKFFGFRK